VEHVVSNDNDNENQDDKRRPHPKSRPSADLVAYGAKSGIERTPMIVAIGASAGGIRVLQDFFATIPDATGAAFVVVVNQERGWRSPAPNSISQQNEANPRSETGQSRPRGESRRRGGAPGGVMRIK
jgi:chemotaxis response regulator CheB